MGKFAEVVKLGAPRRGHWCVMCVFLDGLDDESRSELVGMLRDDSWGDKALAEVVGEHIEGVDARIVDVHRKSRAARG